MRERENPTKSQHPFPIFFSWTSAQETVPQCVITQYFSKKVNSCCCCRCCCHRCCHRCCRCCCCCYCCCRCRRQKSVKKSSRRHLSRFQPENHLNFSFFHSLVARKNLFFVLRSVRPEGLFLTNPARNIRKFTEKGSRNISKFCNLVLNQSFKKIARQLQINPQVLRKSHWIFLIPFRTFPRCRRIAPPPRTGIRRRSSRPRGRSTSGRRRSGC